MTAFTDKTAEISRTPVQLVVITLDSCSLTYGVAPCTASGGAGEECYNTFFTCQDKTNYAKTTKEYKFTSFDAPSPFSGVLPYIKTISTIPTRIEQKLTVKGRRTIQMVDELGSDINIDPYVATRASVQGEYWKKLVARNPNYYGRPVEIYEGYIGLTEAQFVQRWTGTLEDIKISMGIVNISCVDRLAELRALKVPDQIKAKLNVAINDTQTSITLDTTDFPDGSQMSATGYIKVDDEIVYYGAVNHDSNTISSCTRGALSTTAAAHDADAKIEIVKYYAPDNPFDIIQTLLNDAGIDNTDIDTTAWAYWKAWPKTDVDYSAIILEQDSVTADDLFWEIVNLLDCHVWQDESQKITIRRNIANEPGRTYTDISDTSNIINDSANVEYNEQSRRTRYVMYWGKSSVGKFEELSSYSEVDIAIDTDAEGSNGYDSIRDEIIYNRWISKRFLQEESAESYCANLVRRKLLNRTDALPIVSCSLELKDEALETGGNVVLTTDEILKADGSSIADNYMIISRDKINGKVNLQLLKFPKHRICFIAPNTTPAYASATTAEKEYGFIANSAGEMPNGDPGYKIW